MKHLAAVALAASALLGACGDNLRGVVFDDYRDARVAAECTRLVRCGLFAEHATCTSYFRVLDDAPLRNAIENEHIVYDPAAALRCLDELALLGCDETARDVRVPPDACARAFVGTRAVGESCAFGGECASGSCDLPDCPVEACCYGSCLATRTAALGDACTIDDDCVDGAFCGEARACIALAARGEACRKDAHCDFGLACIGASELQAGACRVLPPIGEPCPYLRCAELGATCDADRTCVALGLPGAPCATDRDCSPYARCDASAGACVDVPSLGMACAGPCAGEAWCDLEGSTRCEAPQEATAPCLSDDQCASLYCAEGIVSKYCAERPICP